MLLVLALMTLSFSNLAHANTNPQMRQCRLSGGTFTSVQTSDDIVGLCQLGSAYIGSLDLLYHLDKSATPLSIEIYSQGVTSCDPMGTSRVVKTLEGVEMRLCFYGDGSLIEMNTLQNGISSLNNTELNQALGF